MTGRPMTWKDQPEDLNWLTGQVVDAAVRVHAELGPGLLESVYVACLAEELSARGIAVRREVPVPVVFRGKPIAASFRLDLDVAESVLVEVKAVEVLLPVHTAQLLTYLRLSGRPVGFLLNFHVPLMKQGIHRVLAPRHREPRAP